MSWEATTELSCQTNWMNMSVQPEVRLYLCCVLHDILMVKLTRLLAD